MLYFETRKRRAALILLPVLILASWAIACGETTTETVIQTVVVEKEVIVEREARPSSKPLSSRKKFRLRSSRPSSSRRKWSSRRQAKP